MKTPVRTNKPIKSRSTVSQPGRYYALDTRRVRFIDLGECESMQKALQTRNNGCSSFNRVLSTKEFEHLKQLLESNAQKVSLQDYYYFVEQANQLFYMGEFESQALAERHALSKLFGVPKAFIASGDLLRRAVSDIRTI